MSFFELLCCMHGYIFLYIIYLLIQEKYLTRANEVRKRYKLRRSTKTWYMHIYSDKVEKRLAVFFTIFLSLVPILSMVMLYDGAKSTIEDIIEAVRSEIESREID